MGSYKEYYLRNATIEDVDIIYEWANDKVVRENSFNSKEINYSEHRCWYNSKINSSSTLFFVMMCGDTPVGQVRLELKDKEALVNYSIASQYRGHGLGKLMMKLVEEKINLEYRDIEKLIAEVKQENDYSKNVFIKLGYKESYITFEKIIK